jgi:hypothetical protein
MNSAPGCLHEFSISMLTLVRKQKYQGGFVVFLNYKLVNPKIVVRISLLQLTRIFPR